MKTDYTRRDVIAVGVLALIGTTVTGRAKAQTPPSTQPARLSTSSRPTPTDPSTCILGPPEAPPRAWKPTGSRPSPARVSTR